MHVRRDVLKPAALTARQWALAVRRVEGWPYEACWHRPRSLRHSGHPTHGWWRVGIGAGSWRPAARESQLSSLQLEVGPRAPRGLWRVGVGSWWAFGAGLARGGGGCGVERQFSCCELDGAFFFGPVQYLGRGTCLGGLGHGPWGSRLFSNTHCGKRSASTAPARLIVVMVMDNARLPDAACVAAIRIRRTLPWGYSSEPRWLKTYMQVGYYLLYTAGFLSTVRSRAAPAPQKE